MLFYIVLTILVGAAAIHLVHQWRTAISKGCPCGHEAWQHGWEPDGCIAQPGIARGDYAICGCAKAR